MVYVGFVELFLFETKEMWSKEKLWLSVEKNCTMNYEKFYDKILKERKKRSCYIRSLYQKNIHNMTLVKHGCPLSLTSV